MGVSRCRGKAAMSALQAGTITRSSDHEGQVGRVLGTDWEAEVWLCAVHGRAEVPPATVVAAPAPSPAGGCPRATFQTAHHCQAS